MNASDNAIDAADIWIDALLDDGLGRGCGAGKRVITDSVITDCHSAALPLPVVEPSIRGSRFTAAKPANGRIRGDPTH
jgi:hypothetical protein